MANTFSIELSEHDHLVDGCTKEANHQLVKIQRIHCNRDFFYEC